MVIQVQKINKRRYIEIFTPETKEEIKNMNRKIYRQIAKKHGVSVKEVKHDMQTAIDEAYKDPNLYARGVYSKGDSPTVDEVVDHLARRVKLIIKP